MGRYVGDVGSPQPVSGWSAEVPVDQVRRLPALFGSPGRAHGPPARYPANSGHTHQAGHAFASHADPGLAKFGMDARRPVGTVEALMDQAGPAKQHGILSGPPGHGPPEPGVVAAGGDA